MQDKVLETRTGPNGLRATTSCITRTSRSASRTTCGTKTVTKDEIIAFGRAYDPQPLHVDEEAAKSDAGRRPVRVGLAHLLMMMRLVADGMLNRVASLGCARRRRGAMDGAGAARRLLSCRYIGARRSAIWRRGPMSACPRCWSSCSTRRARRPPTGAPTSSHADAILAPRPPARARSASARRSPACGTSPAPSPARCGPISFSRIARSAS